MMYLLGEAVALFVFIIIGFAAIMWGVVLFCESVCKFLDLLGDIFSKLRGLL